MNKKNQHIDWSSTDSVAAFEALDATIQYAYYLTGNQMVELGYDRRIAQTAFGQYLYHNVMHEVQLLGRNDPSIEAELHPHVRESGHHVVVMLQGLIITISAVEHRGQRPRYAAHRSIYAGQLSFTITDDGKFVVPPLSVQDFSQPAYIQLLHGPEPGNRQRHGFTLLAFLNERGEYLSDVVDLHEKLASIAVERQTRETVREDLRLKFVEQPAKTTRAP